MNWLALFAFFGGACIALQAAMNAQLGQIMKHSLFATSFAFLSSFILATLVIFTLNAHHSLTEEKQTWAMVGNHLLSAPWYLWFSAVLSVIGVGSLYYLIPKMGAGNTVMFALSGQIIIAMMISHFGWFNSPIKLVSFQKIIGIMFLVIAIILINKE